MSVRERILLYLDYREISISAYEKRHDFGNGSIGKFLKAEQKTMGIDKLEKMLKIDPILSAEWLLRGEGEMIIENKVEDKGYSKNSFEKLEREIENLKLILEKNGIK
jgi:hypothetical protein